MTIPPINDPRLAAVKSWLSALPAHYGLNIDSLRAASNDASFRRYFRLDATGGEQLAYVVMDAPPPLEDCRPFVRIAELFAAAQVNAPQIYEADLQHGFLLLQDFGNRVYLDELDEQTAPQLYGDAMRSLIRLQTASLPGVLPMYDEALLQRELMLYPDWYLARHKRVTLSAADQKTLQEAFAILLKNNLAQPSVFVHRDFHSRNLMILDATENPGVLDFQDAVFGPITYDLVSLLRDAYIRWEEPQVLDWCIRYWEQARSAKLPVNREFGEFYRDFEWMGLQRHLKVLGIFARLCYRDGKDRYLNDMPLVLEYVRKAAARYREFNRLSDLIDRIEGDARVSGLTF
jgi:N-acetylmuramate 1-kinase